jgi:TolB-like protein
MFYLRATLASAVKDVTGMGGQPQVVASQDSIRSQVARIVTSATFANARRSQRFLEFTVEQTLAGAQDSVKETVIAIEVFDRKADFDPRIDAIVRVEATKLRVRLSEYYSSEGVSAPVVIEIPKGTYVPKFSLRPEKQEAERIEPTPKRRNVNAAIASGALAALILCGVGIWFAFGPRLRTSPSGEIPAIAVLPFLNLSSEPENAYFSDGLADQLTDALARVDGLRVASRTSAFSFRGKPMEAAEIAAKLHVNSILEGSVQRSNGRLRITLQLIRTRDGYHLWSQTFDRELKNIFEVQDEISRAVTRTLKVSLADDASRKKSRRYTKDAEAFDLYLRGLHVLNSLESDGAGRAIGLFQEAIDRDPQFALAYTGIAIGASQGAFTEVLPPKEIAQQMRSAALKALAIDDTLAEAQAILAAVEAKFDWNWAGAERRLRHAIALDPRSSSVHFGYSTGVLAPQHRWDEALAECRIALDLDPLSVQMAYCIPWTHLFQGKVEQALAEFKKLNAEQPGAFADGIAIALMMAGRESEALAIMEHGKVDVAALIHHRPVELGFLAYCYGRVGRTSEASEIERLLRDAGRRQYTSPGMMSLVYLGLGRLKDAREAASEQIREHSFSIYTLTGPMFAPLRADREFAALLKTTGMPF